MPPDAPTGPTLGQRLETARGDAGYSLRKLAEVTGIPMSSINRLLKDEVAEPSPASLVRLAKVLDLTPSELFALAGLPYPDLDDLLRNGYGLPEEAITEIRAIIDEHTGGEE
jgi:transcriptional regulator with XRE-family HTH domain